MQAIENAIDERQRRTAHTRRRQQIRNLLTQAGHEIAGGRERVVEDLIDGVRKLWSQLQRIRDDFDQVGDGLRQVRYGIVWKRPEVRNDARSDKLIRARLRRVLVGIRRDRWIRVGLRSLGC
jgi:hypothetical protein